MMTEFEMAKKLIVSLLRDTQTSFKEDPTELTWGRLDGLTDAVGALVSAERYARRQSATPHRESFTELVDSIRKELKGSLWAKRWNIR